MNPKDTSEIVKNTTESTKNIAEIIQMILQPRGISATLLEGHKKIIEEVVASDKYSFAEKEFFLANYKKQLKEYKNCKEIAEIAAFSILPDHQIEEMDLDWFSFYFEKAKLVSDESMQKIWGSILAEEINYPNSISRSLIHTLSIIDKWQAKSFCNLCRFCWFDLDYDKVHPFIYISEAHIAYNNSGITWDQLKELEYLGLISCDLDPGYALKGPRRFRTGNIIVNVKGNLEKGDLIHVGNVMFTHNGRKLYDLVDVEYKQYRNDIFSFIEKELFNHNCSVECTNVVRKRF
ncbi:MAG: DUF2806 domain-containing protein [Lachnospiraceae bacterium]|nr:DUF2806 domain-containing protein [Lachnospiraceae bacterium]